MPQKKNPDLTELARAKSGRIIAASHTVELQLKGLPLAYNKDMQETQEAIFAATEESPRVSLLCSADLRQRFNSASDRMLARLHPRVFLTQWLRQPTLCTRA